MMKGQMLVKRLNRSGIYKSSLNYDSCFADKKNPNGCFKIIIQPIQNIDGEYQIRYIRDKKMGVIVSGEFYCITGSNEKEIDEKCKRYMNKRYDNLIQTQVYCTSQLW